MLQWFQTMAAKTFKNTNTRGERKVNLYLCWERILAYLMCDVLCSVFMASWSVEIPQRFRYVRRNNNKMNCFPNTIISNEAKKPIEQNMNKSIQSRILKLCETSNSANIWFPTDVQVLVNSFQCLFCCIVSHCKRLKQNRILNQNRVNELLCRSSSRQWLRYCHFWRQFYINISIQQLQREEKFRTLIQCKVSFISFWWNSLDFALKKWFLVSVSFTGWKSTMWSALIWIHFFMWPKKVCAPFSRWKRNETFSKFGWCVSVC